MKNFTANLKAFLDGTFPELYSRLAKWQDKYTNAQLNESFLNHALDSLRRFCTAMDESETTYWLSFGTLIGAVREKGFIKHDMDIDMAILDTTDFERLDACLRKQGFYLSRRIDIYSKCGEQGFELTYSDGKMPIDIFVFTHLEGNLYYTHGFTGTHPMIGGQRMYTNVFRYTLPFDGVMDYDFLGIKTKIPINYDEYLRRYYGDYMTPDPNWVWHDVSGAIKKVEDSIAITAFAKGRKA